MLHGGTSGLVDLIELPVAQGPDLAAGHDGGTAAAGSGAPYRGQPHRIRRHPVGGCPTTATGVDHVADVRRRPVAETGWLGQQLSTHPAQRRLVEDEGGGRLADGEDQAVGEQHRWRRKIGVVGIVLRPGGRGEVLEEVHGGRQLHHAVTLVVGEAVGLVGTVARRNPHIAGGVDGRGTAAHPDRPLAVIGLVRHDEGGGWGAVFRGGDHQAVIGLTVAVVPPESGDDPPVSQP